MGFVTRVLFVGMVAVILGAPAAAQSPSSKKLPDDVVAIAAEADRLVKLRDFDQAITVAIKLPDRVRQAVGENDPEYASALSFVGGVYLAKRDYQRAEECLLRAAEVTRRTSGAQSELYAYRLLYLGKLYDQSRDLDKAEAVRKQTLDLCVKLFGENHESYVENLHALAVVYTDKHDYPRAEALFKQALEKVRSLHGEKHPAFAMAQYNLGLHYVGAGRYTQGRALLEQALQGIGNAAAQDSELYLERARHLANVCKLMGDYTRAEPILKSLADTRRRNDDAERYGDSLCDLGSLYSARGDFVKAAEHYLVALQVYAQSIGEKNLKVATALYNLANIHHQMNAFVTAEKLYRRSIEIAGTVGGDVTDHLAPGYEALARLYHESGYEAAATASLNSAMEIVAKSRGRESAEFDSLLNTAAILAMDSDDDREAEAILRGIVERTGTRHGEMSIAYADSLVNLKFFHSRRGNLEAAEELDLKVVEIYRKIMGEDESPFARTLSNLAYAKERKGDYAGAQLIFEKCLKLFGNTVGEQHQDYGLTLENLAQLAQLRGDDKLSEAYFRRAAESYTKSVGELHPHFARCLWRLGSLYAGQADYIEAEKAYLQALDILGRTLGEDHREFAACLQLLAKLYERQQQIVKALQVQERAVQCLRKAAGEDHPDYAEALTGMARLHIIGGDAARALDPLQRAWRIQLRQRDHAIAFATEREQAAFLGNVFDGWDLPLTTVSGKLKADAAARRFAADVILQGKGATQDVLSWRRSVAANARDPAIKTLFEAWQQRGVDLNRASLLIPEPREAEVHQARLVELRQQIDAAERTLAQASSRFAAERAAGRVDLRQVLAGLGKDEALIEFARYTEPASQTAATQPARTGQFVAVVMRGEAEEASQITIVPLGDAPRIEAAVQLWRQLLSRPGSAQAEVQKAGAAVAALVWTPVSRELGDRRRVYLCPDGVLAFVPFAALPTSDARLVLDDYDLAYLATGRDIARAQAPSDRPAVLVGSPDFGQSATGNAPPSRLAFAPLAETTREVEAIAALLRSAGQHPTVLTGAHATKQAIRTAVRPSVLHLATHGFFLSQTTLPPAVPLASARGVGGLSALQSNEAQSARAWRNLVQQGPMRRSGIALAGANKSLTGRDGGTNADGILTADEVAQLDLLGTRLVVISACESGLGDVVDGEGVFGLRRAFALAGAQNLVMSLWAVDDQATRKLMEGMYQQIAKGSSPQRALLLSQREYVAAERKMGRYPHPFFWGAFVAGGIGTGLQDK